MRGTTIITVGAVGAALSTITTAAHAVDESGDARTANNLVYAEGLGPGILYSINYERTLGDVSVRAGAGYVAGVVKPSTSDGESRTSTLLLSVPLTVSYLGWASDWSILEVGGGVVPLHVGPRVSTAYIREADTSTTTVLATAFVGYRYQPPSGGLLVRVGISALAGRYGVLPLWPYVAAGGVF